ncbi:MAG: hypothetical protein EAZ89_20075 [Bacteroidetes bacterium]|nr:MAG: hypothetical protein EAZ89_20075 [Bacteroidota bacterium]
MKIRYLNIVFLAALCAACRPGTVHPDQYADWYNRNLQTLTAQKNLGATRWTAAYIPAEILALREYRPQEGPGLSDVLASYKEAEYYLLSISAKDSISPVLTLSSEPQNDYSQAVTYFSYEFQPQIQLIRDGDTLASTLYHFEQSMATQTKIEFLLAFPPATQAHETRVLRIEDRYFGLGPVNISLPSRDINQVPTLTIVKP